MNTESNERAVSTDGTSAELEELRALRDALLKERRSWWRRAAGIVGLVIVTSIATAGAQTVSDSLYVFSAGTPARASEVNWNFNLLRVWLENKVGPVADPNVTVGANASVTGNVTVGANASVTGDVNVTGDQTTAGDVQFSSRGGQRLNLWGREYAMGVQTGTMYSRSNGAFGWFVGGGHDDDFLDPGMDGTGTAGQRVMSLTSSGLSIGAAGTPIHTLLHGSADDCSTAGGSSSGAVTFGHTFASPPLVIVTPSVQTSSSGGTSSRVESVSTTGFTYTTWHGTVLTAADCVHWVAIGS